MDAFLYTRVGRELIPAVALCSKEVAQAPVFGPRDACSKDTSHIWLASYRPIG